MPCHQFRAGRPGRAAPLLALLTRSRANFSTIVVCRLASTLPYASEKMMRVGMATTTLSFPPAGGSESAPSNSRRTSSNTAARSVFEC